VETIAEMGRISIALCAIVDRRICHDFSAGS
jgi:hypothetical protein